MHALRHTYCNKKNASLKREASNKLSSNQAGMPMIVKDITYAALGYSLRHSSSPACGSVLQP